MKIFPLIFVALFACEVHPIHRVSSPVVNEDARDSVFKLNVSSEIDLTSLKELLADEEIPNSIKMNSSGTAWVVKNTNKDAYLVTAGHVCGSDVYHSDIGDFPMKSLYTIESASGKLKIKADVVKSDDDLDLCLLHVDYDVGQQLEFASADPVYGAEVEYIGEAGGIWGGGISPIYKGLFSGRGDLWNNGNECLTITMNLAGGASGSPLLYGGKVIGVITNMANNFHGIGTAVPWNTAKKFVDKYIIK